MKFAFYKGTSRPFNKLVVWKTGGPYSHVEAVFGINPITGLYICASSSFQDGGIRFKEIDLHPDRWDIIDVPGIDAASVAQWFVEHEFYIDKQGRLRQTPYDVRGLVNFIIPVGHNSVGYFCDEAAGAAADVPQPHRFDPTDLACIFERMGGIWIQGWPAWRLEAAPAIS